MKHIKEYYLFKFAYDNLVTKYNNTDRVEEIFDNIQKNFDIRYLVRSGTFLDYHLIQYDDYRDKLNRFLRIQINKYDFGTDIYIYDDPRKYDLKKGHVSPVSDEDDELPPMIKVNISGSVKKKIINWFKNK